MSKFQKFITDLFTPVVTVRGTSEKTKSSITPVNKAILTYVGVEAISGPDSTILDKAAFVATPYILNVVSDLGAQKGYEESKK
jgi:hypothetical protein